MRTFLLCAVLASSVVWAQADASQYSFEQGTQGWVISGDAISAADSTSAKPYAGARSLEVAFNANGARTNQSVMVANPAVGPGKTVTFRLFVPAGAAIGSVQAFVQESASTQWRYTAQWKPASALTFGAWNTLQVTVPANASALQSLGVTFETSGAYAGHVYVDAVDWPVAQTQSTGSGTGTASSSGFTFEQGTQGWASSTATLSTTAAQHFDGAQSLNAALGSQTTQSFTVANPGVPAGSAISFHVFFPAGAPVKAIQAFVQESAATSWRYTADWKPAASLTPGAWNTFTVTVPADASAVQTLGVQVELNASWAGAVQVDGVTWGGAPPPPPPPPPATGSCLKVMPLGDSITEGVNGGYRNVLWTDLGALGCGVNYVGSRFDPYAKVSDKDHEGHPGYSIADVRSGVQPWLAAYAPDYILLLIGTNDIAWWSVKSGADVAADQAALIDRIQQLRPSAWIIVGSIPPITPKAIPPNNVDRAQLARDYNAAAKARIDARIAAGQKIRWADVNAVLTLSDLYDGVHPTEAAHAKIAHVWRQALQGLVSCPGPATCP